MNFFNVDFDNNENIFLSLADRFRNHVAVFQEKWFCQQSIHFNVSL